LKDFVAYENSLRPIPVKNPENDPVGADLESTLKSINLVRNFPPVESFSWELSGLLLYYVARLILKGV
jgi:hypothetical protein